MKILLGETDLFHMDRLPERQIDRQTGMMMLIVAFRHFAIAPKIILQIIK